MKIDILANNLFGNIKKMEETLRLLNSKYTFTDNEVRKLVSILKDFESIAVKIEHRHIST